MRNIDVTSFPERPPWLIGLITVVVFLLIDNTNLPLYRALIGDLQGNARLPVFIAVIYGSTILGPMLVATLVFGKR